MLVGIALTLIAMLVAIALAGAAYLRSKRHQELPQVATAAGLQFSTADPFNSLAVPFALFRAGDGRTIENVMWRDGCNGQPVRVFDYSWYAEHQNDGRVEQRWSYHCCATGQHNGSWPQVEITRERVIDRLGEKLGLRSVDLESEEFNRTFFVRCDNPKFATDLLSPQMMELLLTTEGKISFFTRGRFVMLATSRLDAPLMPGLLNLVDEFIARIPPVVFDLYGKLPDGAGTEIMPVPDLGEPRPSAFSLGPSTELRRPGDYTFAPAPDRNAENAWDPTPGIEHDLDGKVVEIHEDPWGPGRPPPA